ncbi:MAG: hypothetical protein AB1938_08325 [Myxococcota bacterium]
MVRLLLVASAVLALGGCALRPRYADFVSPSTKGEKVTFLLAEKGTGRPLPNVQVEMSELKNRVRVTTAADGTFSLPVDAVYVKENPVIVVAVPRGVSGYDLTVVTAAPPPAVAPPAPELPPAPAPAAPEPSPSGAPAPAPVSPPANG